MKTYSQLKGVHYLLYVLHEPFHVRYAAFALPGMHFLRERFAEDSPVERSLPRPREIASFTSKY